MHGPDRVAAAGTDQRIAHLQEVLPDNGSGSLTGFLCNDSGTAISDNVVNDHLLAKAGNCQSETAFQQGTGELSVAHLFVGDIGQCGDLFQTEAELAQCRFGSRDLGTLFNHIGLNAAEDIFGGGLVDHRHENFVGICADLIAVNAAQDLRLFHDGIKNAVGEIHLNGVTAVGTGLGVHAQNGSLDLFKGRAGAVSQSSFLDVNELFTEGAVDFAVVGLDFSRGFPFFFSLGFHDFRSGDGSGARFRFIRDVGKHTFQIADLTVHGIQFGREALDFLNGFGAFNALDKICFALILSAQHCLKFLLHFLLLLPFPHRPMSRRYVHINREKGCNFYLRVCEGNGPRLLQLQLLLLSFLFQCVRTFKGSGVNTGVFIKTIVNR